MITALYIHFPFCLSKCPYCDFNSRAVKPAEQPDYVDLLLREMELRRERLAGEVAASTLYFGGGTPSLLSPLCVARIITAAKRLFALQADAEITIEANPGTVTRERLAGYRLAGVNRLSLGIQSFSEPMLLTLGRVHSVRDGLDAFAAARDAGFANIGIDLIHSLPGQTQEMWRAELIRAVALRPEHISAYGLTIEAGTPFHAMEQRGELTLPGEEEAAGMFEQTSEFLCRAGYEHYEISNFALPGQRSRHNQVYWQRGSYLGFGAGAHSFLKEPPYGSRWNNPDSPENYLQALNSGIAPAESLATVEEREALAEKLFLGLRMLEGVDVESFRQEFGVTPEEAYPAQLPELLGKGLLEWREERLRLTRRGIILANQVFIRFV